jgi:hypothetical protein
MTETAQIGQKAIKTHRLTRRSLVVLILTLLVMAYMRLGAPAAVTPNMVAVVMTHLAVAAALWGIIHRYLNFTAALIFGLMYALSPWAIFYARDSANYGLLADGNTANPIVYMAWVATGLGVEQVVAPEAAENLLATVPRPGEIWLLTLGAAVLLGFPALWFRSRLFFVIVVLWVVIPILIGLATDYLVPTPLPLCLLAGAGVAWLIKLLPGKPYSRMIVLSAYGVIFLSQALWWRGVLRFLESR